MHSLLTVASVLLLPAVFYLIYCLPAGIKKEKVDNALPDFDERKAVEAKDTRSGAASELATSPSAGLELQRTGAAAPPAGP